MARLLFEIGTEELPASFVAQGLRSLSEAAKTLLGQARLGDSLEVVPLGTPRRLAIMVDGLPTRQDDLDELIVGPPESIGFDDQGKPTKAAAGFAAKNDVSVDALLKHKTEKGVYVAARVQKKGQDTAEVLCDVVPQICAKATFPKVMRWGPGDIAFGRPIHWLLGLLDDAVLPFEFAGLVADRQSLGHRFLHPGSITVASASDYISDLKAADVWVDPVERRNAMTDALQKEAGALGGTLHPDAFLVDECLSLVEAPHVVPGAFDPSYLSLPDSVVVSVMRDHQRYFAVRDKEGALLPAYLNVVNTAQDKDAIQQGNDRVLRARLADARFFVDEDKKQPLIARLDKLATVVFQKRLGTVGEKIARIKRLASHLAESAPNVSADKAALAADLCKADLETLIVYEFPELQGQMGRWYAQAEGVDEEVARAIEDHYKPKGADDEPPQDTLSAIVSVADRIDTLVGCFGIGLTPTGSADPFALRRAALGVTRIALSGTVDVDLRSLIAFSHAGFHDSVGLMAVDELSATLLDFFGARLKAFMKERHPSDVVEACLSAWQGGPIGDLDMRMVAVSEFRQRAEFEALSTAFKRAHNITKDTVRGPINAALLEDGAETALATVFEKTKLDIEQACSKQAYGEALGYVATSLRQPIDRFFEEVFVMVDDEAVRQNRLNLLGDIADSVNRIAHLHQLST